MISIEEINDLYKKCGVKNEPTIIRTTINTGSLDNSLNTTQVSAWNTNFTVNNSIAEKNMK